MKNIQRTILSIILMQRSINIFITYKYNLNTYFDKIFDWELILLQLDEVHANDRNRSCKLYDR